MQLVIGAEVVVPLGPGAVTSVGQLWPFSPGMAPVGQAPPDRLALIRPSPTLMVPLPPSTSVRLAPLGTVTLLAPTRLTCAGVTDT